MTEFFIFNVILYLISTTLRFVSFKETLLFSNLRCSERYPSVLALLSTPRKM